MGYKYFVGEYEEYANELTGVEELKDYKNSLSDNEPTLVHSSLTVS